MKLIYRKYFAKAALFWAGCFVLLLFVYMLVLAPQQKSKAQIENRLAQKKQTYDLAQKATLPQTGIQLNKEIEKLQNNLEKFVIDFKDSANLTFDISRIASEKKVASFSIKNKNNQPGSAISDCENICENYIDVSFTSSFNQFAAFLNDLERHRPVVFVDKFKITRSQQDNSGHQVKMNLVVFVRKQLHNNDCAAESQCTCNIY